MKKLFVSLKLDTVLWKLSSIMAYIKITGMIPLLLATFFMFEFPELVCSISVIFNILLWERLCAALARQSDIENFYLVTSFSNFTDIGSWPSLFLVTLSYSWVLLPHPLFVALPQCLFSWSPYRQLHLPRKGPRLRGWPPTGRIPRSWARGQ